MAVNTSAEEWGHMEVTNVNGREGKSERELAGTTKPTMETRCFLRPEDGSTIRYRKLYSLLGKWTAEEGGKKKSMYSGCKKSFASCLPLSTGDCFHCCRVASESSPNSSCWGWTTFRLSDHPWRNHAPSSHRSQTCTHKKKAGVLLASVGKFAMY